MWNAAHWIFTLASSVLQGLAPAPAGPVEDIGARTPSETSVAVAREQTSAPQSGRDAAPAARLAARPPAGPEAVSNTAPANDTAELERLVRGLQKTYEGTRDFQASFTQKFTYTLLRRTQESKGTVQFKKPGRMRWDYLKPNPKSFIVDGKSLWIYQPENRAALVNPCFQQDGLSASVAFLWGDGRVDEQFDVSRFAGRFGDAQDEHLELVPKTPNSVFTKLILVLDPKSFRVKQSVVIDAQGNVNQFIFENAKFNQGAAADAFAFAPPKDTVITEMPTSCSGAPKP